MNLKMTLVGAALSLSLAPLAARADENQQQPCDQQQPQNDPQTYQQSYDQQYQQYRQDQPAYYGQPYQQQPVYQQPAYPPMDRQGDRSGRYEQRIIQRWVPGQYRSVWVPEQCSYRFRERGWGWHRREANVCVPAHYTQQWTTGYYESVPQWVWVPYAMNRYQG
jgi:hypothetical protein